MRDGNLIEDDYDKVQRTVDNLDTNTLHLNIVDFLVSGFCVVFNNFLQNYLSKIFNAIFADTSCRY